MSPLKIAGEHDPRLFADHLPCMDMSQRPVVVPFSYQRWEIGWRVGIVSNTPGQAGVQHADIKKAMHRRRIGRDKVFLNRALRKTAPMNRH